MSDEREIKQDLAHVEHYLMENYEVYVALEEDGLDEYWFDPDDPDDPGVISINTSNDLEMQLFVLLHEAGHVMLRRQQEFSKYFPDSNRATVDGRIEILKEEVSAWLKAQELAEDLGIKLDASRWELNYRQALFQYVEWVSKGDCND